MATLKEKQLGQLRPANGLPASIYSPNSGTDAIIKVIVVCNVSNSEAEYSIYQDDDGTTYDEDTALFYKQPIKPRHTLLLEFVGSGIAMDNPAGNLAVQSNVPNGLTFTVSGTEIIA